jgi:hypothetical protein
MLDAQPSPAPHMADAHLVKPHAIEDRSLSGMVSSLMHEIWCVALWQGVRRSRGVL